MNHGDIALESTLDFKFTTINSSGVATSLLGSPVVVAYPNNSTTEVTAGITITADFDTLVGLNHVRVVATAANGYATGTNYDLVLTAGTVDGTIAARYVVGQFSIQNRSALRPTTAGRALDVSATGEAGLDWANIGSPTTSQALSGTMLSPTRDLALYTGTVANADNSFIDLGTLGLGNDELNDHLIRFRDNSTGEYHAKWIDDFDGTDSLALLHSTLPFTTESGVDTWTVYAIRRDDNVLDLIGLIGSPVGGSVAAALTAIKTIVDALSASTIVASGIIGSTGNTITALHLAGLPFGDDELNGLTIVIRDVSASEYHVRTIDDWADTSDLATVATLPFTPQNATDTYWILTSKDSPSGGTADWTADQRTALSAILGIPGSGTTPADPATGILDTIRDVVVLVKAVTDNLIRAAKCVTEGTVDSGATTTSIPTSSLSPAAVVANQFQGEILGFPDDTTTTALRGQKTRIASNTSGGVFTVEALTTPPVAGDVFVIE